MENFATIVNGFQPLTVVTKLSILDTFGGSGYASEFPFCKTFVRLSQFFGIALTEVESTLKEHLRNVASTLSNVENPASDFILFSTSVQCYLNIYSQRWNNVDVTLKCRLRQSLDESLPTLEHKLFQCLENFLFCVIQQFLI